MFNRSTGRGSSSESPQASPSEVDPTRLNDSLYQLHQLPGTPNMQILFFHGIEFERSNAVHFNTWKSQDGNIWPEEWLAADFPRAQIFYVCYDGVVRKDGNLDMYLIRENLIQDVILHANIGQTLHCPVILVGHCLGGMVIKQFCLEVFYRAALGTFEFETVKLGTFEFETVKLQRFLKSVKGIFYYSTPHRGNSFLDKLGTPDLRDNVLLMYFKKLNKKAARLNQKFDELCGKTKWRIYGLGANRPTDWGRFRNVDVVPEASARQGSSFQMIAEDHISICKPKSTTASGYTFLKTLLGSISSDIKGVVSIQRSEVSHQFDDGRPNIYVGLKERADKAQKMLANATVLGILGMGGVGKSTIARQVFKDSSERFEERFFICFNENVKDMSNYELKNWVLNHRHESGAKVDGRRKDWCSLQGKKTLLVVDNVSSKDQLSVFPKLEDLGNGSHVIITSRDGRVLDFYSKHVVSTYEVNFLEYEEARELFCQHAFGVKGIPINNGNPLLEEHVKRVVEKCEGLPLTLEVMGSYLWAHEEDAGFWDKAIEELGEGRAFDKADNDIVWARLRISYDSLHVHEKEMFIEAGTIFFAQPVEKALAAWSTQYAYSEMRWETLLRTSMVKQVRRSIWDPLCDREIQYMNVWVHEHLRDLAKSLLKDKLLPGLSKHVYKSFFVINESWVRAEPKSLQLQYAEQKYLSDLDDGLIGLDEDLTSSDEDLTSSDEDLPYSSENQRASLLSFLGDFGTLKYLELDRVHEVLGGKFLPRQLSLLRWNSTSMSNLPRISLKEMKDLAVLELADWVVPEKFPEALVELTELRMLFLRRLDGLDYLPENFGNMSELTRLELVCLRLSKLPDSICKLSKLKHLILINVSISELPEAFGDHSKSTSSSGHLSRSLMTLTIRSCRKLSSLPISFGGLSSLKELYIIDCPNLSSHRLQTHNSCRQEMSCSFQGNLPALEYISLKECPSLGGLPASFKDLSALEDLVVEDCNSLRGLSSDLGHCKALKRLTITGDLGDREALSNSFGNFSALSHLSIKHCRTLEQLPTSFVDLSTLEELVIHGCPRLQKLPDNFGKLLALKRLTIQGAYYLDALPPSVVHMPSLREITLISCEGLKRLPPGDGDTEMAATDGLRVFVKDCPSLNKHTLPRMGWVSVGEDSYWYPENRPHRGRRSGLDAN